MCGHPDYIFCEILSEKVGGGERKEGRRDGGRRKTEKEGREGGRKEGEKRRERKKNNSTELTRTCALHLVSPITSFRLQHSLVTRNLTMIPTISLAQIAHFTGFHANIPMSVTMPVSVFMHLVIPISLCVSLCV